MICQRSNRDMSRFKIQQGIQRMHFPVALIPARQKEFKYRIAATPLRAMHQPPYPPHTSPSPLQLFSTFHTSLFLWSDLSFSFPGNPSFLFYPWHHRRYSCNINWLAAKSSDATKRCISQIVDFLKFFWMKHDVYAQEQWATKYNMVGTSRHRWHETRKLLTR